jgi:N-[(2S)-2-amino-2-carboxyethyl]-L-glutamate dehydrogenase
VTTTVPTAQPSLVSGPGSVPPFAVIPGNQVEDVLRGREKQVVELVEATYRMHSAGQTVNPPSYFLRFQDRPSSRIIALPASIGGSVRVDGVKWISSFPENVGAGIPRASAVLILNDYDTGYPFACLESSIISAARTAASAALAATAMSETRPRPRSVTFFGTGLIARYIYKYLRCVRWEFDTVNLYDANTDYARQFKASLAAHDATTRIVVQERAEESIRSSDLIVFATTAGKPHVHEVDWFAHDPLVLHVSLRDLSPDIILNSTNIVDDVEHCLRADTSVHLAEQRIGSRDFVSGTLYDVLERNVGLPAGRPLVFSPFGLGVLDLAVGSAVYAEGVRQGVITPVEGFFHVLDRYA